MNFTPEAFTASRTSRASGALLAEGFSLKTCLPAAIARRFHGPCRPFGRGL